MLRTALIFNFDFFAVTGQNELVTVKKITVT